MGEKKPIVSTPIFMVLIIWLVSFFSIGEVPAEEHLDLLLQDYLAHGLPLPSDSAVLVLRRPGERGFINGKEQVFYFLSLHDHSDEKEGKPFYWLGANPIPYRSQWETYQEISPSVQNLAKTIPAKHDHRWREFPTYPDLALGVQCYARGWEPLAKAILDRSRDRWGRDSFDQRKPRPRDDRTALAELAWNYWCNQFAREKGDRHDIVNRLKGLVEGPYGLDNEARRTLLADMTETRQKPTVQVGSLEAAVDGLVDIEVEGGWPGCGYAHFNMYTDRNSHFKKLRDAGMDAVPLLIDHMHDFRLTRCMESTRGARYTWHIRVADVVAVLLNGLIEDEFAYDFREKEGAA